MLYDAGAQAFLDAGGVPNFFVAALIEPVDLASGNPVALGYWSGHEDVSLPLGGVDRVLFKTRGGLQIDNPVFAVGTEIRSQSAHLFGLSAQARDLLQAYQVRFRPMEFWHLVFDQGFAFQGAGRFFKGVVDDVALDIGKKGEGASLTITGQTSARKGTQTTVTRKSNESYLRRNGDTSMEYASLTSTDTDTWGPRG